MSAVARFQQDFLSASPGARAQIVQAAVQQNMANSQILNLISNVDYNASQSSNRADNIFFICRMLRAFPDFKYD